MNISYGAKQKKRVKEEKSLIEVELSWRSES